MQEEKIIMYDSPEAAEIKTVTGWVSGGRYFGNDEHFARYNGCTHMKCDCGNVMRKGWSKCESCRNKSAKEKYLNYPFKEWNQIDPVVERDGDKYFFNLEDLHYYMEENEMKSIDLLYCQEIHYRKIDYEDVCQDAHDDWEPEDILEKAIDEFNKVLESLPAHSYEPAKIRTTYVLPIEPEVKRSVASKADQGTNPQ